jgi:Flp pilus assembly protein TadD
MENATAIADFKDGLRLLRDGHPSEAIECLSRAAESERQNPYYLSFLGVSFARGRRKWAEALELCETAVKLKRDEAQLYLNLAEVYLCAERRDKAIKTLDAGLAYLGKDSRLMQARSRLGKRGSSVLPFLDRGHFLNVSLGKFRHRALRSLRKSDDA